MIRPSVMCDGMLTMQCQYQTSGSEAAAEYTASRPREQQQCMLRQMSEY